MCAYKGLWGTHTKREVTCLQCGKAFTVVPARKDSAKFCSVECRLAHTATISVVCSVCGKAFTVLRSSRNKKFCSVECHDNSREGRKVKCECKNCGRVFYSYSRQSGPRVFCSMSCSNKYAGKTEWDNQKVIEHIQSMQQRGEPLNAAYCRDNRLDVFKASINAFGSWNSALKASGIDFEKVRLDRKTSSYKGLIFENMVEELYRLSNIPVRRKPSVSRCHPDFIEENTGIWVDAKLRSWTVGIEETIDKYIKHTHSLQIIYLGGGRREYRSSDGVTFVSVCDKFPIIDRLESSDKIRTSLKELEKQDVKDERFKTWSRTWSPERIVTQLRQIAGGGESISAGHLATNHPRLYGAIQSKMYFTDWASAVKAAGFDPEQHARVRGWKQVYATYQEAKRVVEKLGIQSQQDYKKRYKQGVRLPSHPDDVYRNKGWVHWREFLGR